MKDNRNRNRCVIILLIFCLINIFFYIETKAIDLTFTWDKQVDDNIFCSFLNSSSSGKLLVITPNEKNKDANIIDDMSGQPWREQNNITSVEIGSGIKSIGVNAFFGMNSMSMVTISSSCEIIKTAAFAGCTNLNIIKLNDGLKEIDASAFAGCTGLKEIMLPSTVEQIGDGIFDGCSSLEFIIVNETNVNIVEKLKQDGYEEKLKIIKDNYIYDGKLYINGELASNKKYILTKADNTNIINDVIIDEENNNMLDNEYITYLINSGKIGYYIWETDTKAQVQLVANTNDYTGFYNGKAYLNGNILKNSFIALPKETNISSDVGIYVTYEIITEDEMINLEAIKQQKDIYFVDEFGELSHNLSEGYNNHTLIGDINLDDSVDIADVILLNKNLLGLVMLSDEQRNLADCFADNKIDSTDSLALLKYVVGIEKKLPVDLDEKLQQEIFLEDNYDEFYNTFILKTYSSFNFSEMAKLIHKQIRQEAIKEEGILEYTDQNIEIKKIYENGKFGNNINRNSYIGLCLYEYALQEQNEYLISYITECQGKIYDITEDKLEKLGWQKIAYTSEEQLQRGDIIVSEEVAQIYLGDGIYSCENNEMIRDINLSTPTKPENGKYIIRIEPKFGKSEGIDWKLEDGTLEVEVNGVVDENIIPWKASISDISDYKITVNTDNVKNSILMAKASINTSMRKGGQNITFYANDFIEIIEEMRIQTFFGYNMKDYNLSVYKDKNNQDRYVVNFVFELDDQYLDEFYKHFINGKIGFSRNANMFYEISKIVKTKITDNPFTYNKAIGICIPDEIYNEGKFGPYIDCSSYVTMCIYEYGIHIGDENLIRFVYNYRNETLPPEYNIRIRRANYGNFILLFERRKVK